MQGYRGGNRQRFRATLFCRGEVYLMSLLLTCLSAWTLAQSLPDKPSLTWFVPKAPFHRGGEGMGQLVAYTSLTELAEKLSIRGDKPYHLTLRLEKNTSADWQVLRHIASPTSLAVEVTDSLMSAELLPIMAGWTKLERLEIRSLLLARQMGRGGQTITFSGKGNEVHFSFKPTYVQVPKTGWEKLITVKQVTLDNELNLQQAITALSTLPALEALSIQQYAYNPKQDVSALAGLSRLKRLTIVGQAKVPPAVFKGLTNLQELTIYDPDVAQLNEGLTYLKNLKQLEVHCFPTSALRLGTLHALQSVHIHQIPNRSVLVPNDVASASAAKRSIRSLDSTFAGLSTLQRLTVEGMKLDLFPASLLENKGLVFLSMADVDIADLPANLDQLSALEELIVDNNPLHRLPDAICRLPQLRWLSASSCELDSLPSTIGQLTYLTNLSLNSNQLTSLPLSMGQLRNLRQLNLSMNQLTYLPDFLGTLPKLEIIAAFWNKITRFPIGLRQVRELYLTDNQISELPASIGTLKRLRTLLLDSNPLTYLPESISQLDSLETLVLGRNQLTALPETFGSLRRLSRFILGQNQVRSLPETISGLTSLTSITISNNPMGSLPMAIGAWEQLKRVDLNLPQLEALPEAIGRWKRLELVSIESDRLLFLPNELADCQQLTGLAVTGKRLIGLPESLGKLVHLEWLTLDGRADSVTSQGLGQVVVLPSSLALCVALTDLRIQHQQQFDAVEAMQVASLLPALTRMTFVNCGITDLSGVSWKNLQISTLNLWQNRISQLPESVLDMPNLEDANFSETNLPQELNRYFRTKSELAEALKKMSR